MLQGAQGLLRNKAKKLGVLFGRQWRKTPANLDLVESISALRADGMQIGVCTIHEDELKRVERFGAGIKVVAALPQEAQGNAQSPECLAPVAVAGDGSD